VIKSIVKNRIVSKDGQPMQFPGQPGQCLGLPISGDGPIKF